MLKPLPAKGIVTILAVVPDSPAAHAGLKPHDSFLATDGHPIVEGAVVHGERTRGPPCSSVVLTVQSPGGGNRGR
jgi:C-terminal processing protease CtpA/Prc